jgi:hypothetical protein
LSSPFEVKVLDLFAGPGRRDQTSVLLIRERKAGVDHGGEGTWASQALE